MTAKKLMISALIFFGLLSQGAMAATAKSGPLQGSKMSLSQAKSMALGAYCDGTNIVIINYSQDPVDVEVPDLGVYPHLDPVGTGNNVYYLYAYDYFDSVWINIYDSYDGYLLSSGYVDNNSTVEIRDYYGFKATTGHSRPSIKMKRGL